MAYYYLVASLPMLDIEEPSPLSPEGFLVACQGVLSPEDGAEVALALSGRAAEGRHPFLVRWTERETQLRDALVRARASALRSEAEPFRRSFSGFDVTTENAAAAAMAMDNPLERERLLDAHRWRTIDELVGPAGFGVEAVLGFALKLRLTERWRTMTEERGLEKIEQCLEALQQTS